jgi:hypothetical protein
MSCFRSPWNDRFAASLKVEPIVLSSATDANLFVIKVNPSSHVSMVHGGFSDQLPSRTKVSMFADHGVSAHIAMNTRRPLAPRAQNRAIGARNYGPSAVASSARNRRSARDSAAALADGGDRSWPRDLGVRPAMAVGRCRGSPRQAMIGRAQMRRYLTRPGRRHGKPREWLPGGTA